jgi:hypothetical protein
MTWPVTGATTGGVSHVDIQGSTIHELGRVLSDAVEWRVRSATIKLTPNVANTAAGAYAAILAPSNWAPTDFDNITYMGGTWKKITQTMSVTIASSDDEWKNHANGKARLYVSGRGTSALGVELIATFSGTIQVRGKR